MARQISTSLATFFVFQAILFSLMTASGEVCAESESNGDASPRDTVYALPTVEIEETRPAREEDISHRPGFATVATVDEQPSPTTTTTDLLAMMPGVRVRRFGGRGSYSAISIRGSNPNQVAFYLDGVPLNQAQYGVVNAADFPIAALERVEVYQGSAPIRFANAGGGVVHLVTRQAHGNELTGRLSYGDFDTRIGQIWGSRVSARTSLFAAYQFTGSHGTFSFLDDNATDFNLDDDEITFRRNNEFKQHGLTAKLDLALGSLPTAARQSAQPSRTSPRNLWGSAGRLILAVDFFQKDNGLPGISAYQSRTANFETLRGIASATWESPLWMDGHLELRSQVYANSVRERFSDLDNDLGSGPQQSEDRSRSWGARQEAWANFGPAAHRLGVLGEWRQEQFEPSSLLDPEPISRVSKREVWSLGVEDRLQPFTRRLTLLGDLRHDAVKDEFPAGPSYFGSLDKPEVMQETEATRLHLGLLVQLPAGLTLRGNASRNQRVPSLFELFGNRGTVVGNRDLVPERLDSQDVGLSWRWQSSSTFQVSLESSLYRTDAQDLIIYIQNSQNTSVAQNLSAARLRGLESTLGLRVLDLHLTGNWTVQETENQSAAPSWNGNQLPGRPAHEVFTRAQYKRPRWRVFHEYQYVSSNYLDRANRREVDERHLHHLGAGVFVVPQRLEFSAEVRNLTDNRVQDVTAYPLPGRAFAVTVEGRL